MLEVVVKKSYIMLLLFAYSLFLSSGCAGKLTNPVLIDSNGVTQAQTSYKSVAPGEKLIETTSTYCVADIASNSRYITVLQSGINQKVIDLQSPWEVVPEDQTLGMAFSPDSKLLAYNSESGLKVINLSSGDIARTVDISQARSFSFSHDGKHIAVAFPDNVGVYDFDTEKMLFKHATQDASLISFSPDGESVLVYNCNNMTFIPQLGWVGVGLYMAHSLGAFSDDCFRVFDWKSGKILHEYTAEDRCIYTIDFTPDGQFIVLGMTDDGIVTEGVIEVRDAHTGAIVFSWEVNPTLLGVAISPDSKRLVAYFKQYKTPMQVFSLESGQMEQEMACAGITTKADFSEDGRYLGFTVMDAPIYGNGGVGLYDLESKQLVYSSVFDWTAYDVGFLPDGSSMFIAGDGGVRMVPLQTLTPVDRHTERKFMDTSSRQEGLTGCAVRP